MSRKISFNEIRLFVMDVDGTLTDGKIYCSKDGELFKAFNVKDGYAIAHILPQYNIIPVIITGRESEIVKYRAKELGIEELYQNVGDKAQTLKSVCKKYNCSPDNVAYIGDDANDLSCIEICGFSACPADALTEVAEACDYVCKNQGGNGAVREVIDCIIK